MSDLHGYRLARFEFSNWGTFNRSDRVEIFQVAGHNALITGANGAGKSTLVDGLQALLIPPGNRSYNKASGNKTRERSDVTYIEGWYGQSADNPDIPERLRTKGEKTLLLAVFENAATKDTVALGGIFWIEKEKAEHLYLVRRGECSIKADFGKLPAGRDLKKTLRERGFEPYTEHSDFATRFRGLLKIPHESALKLLSQAVGLKDPQDINVFVRRYMLEPHDMKPAIAKLREHLEDLVACKARIDEAERRQKLLEPIEAEAKRLEELRADSVKAAEAAKAVRPFFAQLLVRWARVEGERVGTELSAAKADLAAAEQELANRRNEEKDLDIALRKNSAHDRLQSITHEIEMQETLRRDRLQSFQFAQTTLEKAGESLVLGDAAGFDAAMGKWRNRQKLLTAEIEDLRNRRADQMSEKRRLEEENERDVADLEVIKAQASNIPAELLRLRKELAAAAEVPEARLPFAGELIEVPAENATWRPAIERVMRPFGLSLLVPDTDPVYAKVAGYIRRSHLNQRLVFYKVRTMAGVRFVADAPDPKRVWGKVRIREDHPMQAWLSREIRQLYDHVCCDTADEFERAPRGLSKEGLIAHSDHRREKDDRRRLGDAKDYVLGWSNRDKVAALAKAITTRVAEIDKLAKAAKSAEDTIGRRSPLLQALTLVVETATFEKIDHATPAHRIVELKAEEVELLKKDSVYARLKERHDKAVTKVAEADADEKTKRERVIRLDDEAKRLGQIPVQKAELLTPENAELASNHAPTLEGLLGKVAVTSDSYEAELNRVDIAARGAATKKANAVGTSEKAIIGLMGESQRLAFNASLLAKIEALPDFRQTLVTLVKEDLPRHRDRFKELMEKNVVRDAGKLASELHERSEFIEERLKELNVALREVPFDPGSYIQLEHNATANADVVEFKKQLRAATQKGTNWNDLERVAAFERIQKLLADFESKPDWRNYVTDVRNWWEFKAVELAEADNAHIRTYYDSTGRSPGQKAKLAYTLLVAGLVLQFGLSRSKPESKTFRFVMVDEIFKGVDKDNSLHAMRLFKEFGLQLILVNPWNDEIKLIERENFVASYHLVTNRDQRDSRLYSISREDLLKKLEKLREEPAGADSR